jgi:multicomponent K+:H+ antiporter subunit D
VIETLPIAGLLAASVALVLQAEPGFAYTRAAADPCMRPRLYIDAVMGARPVRAAAGAAP